MSITDKKLSENPYFVKAETVKGHSNVSKPFSESIDNDIPSIFLAHLWGAYAILVALSGVHRTLCVVCVHH